MYIITTVRKIIGLEQYSGLGFEFKFLLLLGIPLLCMSFLKFQDPIIRKEKVFVVYTKDSVMLEVDLLFNSEDEPIKYYSYVVTPVCEEGVCYNLIAEVYWDLLGNFMEYREAPLDPFTKFDHIKFTKEDHYKMREILQDKTSLLANYKAEDLVDHSVQIKSEVIDGVAGATFKSLSGAVVRGAVYSSHTLWHIVNGKVAEEIVAHTESLLTEKLIVQMLNSDNYHLQFYALNKVNTDNEMYLPYLIRLVAEGDSYVPFFAIEKIPKWSWASDKYQVQIISLLKKVEFQMQNEILNKFIDKDLGEEALTVMASAISCLNKSQLKKTFKILNNNRENITASSIQEVLLLLDSENLEIANAAFEFLSTFEKEHGFISKKMNEHRENLISN